MENDQTLRKELLVLLRGGSAHMPFDEAVADFPEEAINSFAPHVAYTPWHLLEHIRRAQNDILEYIRDPHYVSPEWPAGYWPTQGEKATRAGWDATIQGFHRDMVDLEALVQDPRVSLTAPLPHAPDATVFREILLVSDHNAYHIGEFAVLRQVMGTWRKKG